VVTGIGFGKRGVARRTGQNTTATPFEEFAGELAGACQAA
jgi:hypothetical protein